MGDAAVFRMRSYMSEQIGALKKSAITMLTRESLNSGVLPLVTIQVALLLEIFLTRVACV